MTTVTKASLYDAIADLPLEIDGYDVGFRKRTCAGDFARISVILCLQEAHPGQRGVVLQHT